jgi:hypothetical protein
MSWQPPSQQMTWERHSAYETKMAGQCGVAVCDGRNECGRRDLIQQVWAFWDTSMPGRRGIKKERRAIADKYFLQEPGPIKSDHPRILPHNAERQDIAANNLFNPRAISRY